MFAYLIRQSLTHRIFVLCGAAVLVVVGLLQMRQVPVDVLPEIDRSIVSVLTESGGLSAEEVERRISFPIETAMTVGEQSGHGTVDLRAERPALGRQLFTPVAPPAHGAAPEELLSAAGKLPGEVGENLVSSPAAVRFVCEATALGLTTDEWEKMRGMLLGLREAEDRRGQ